MKKHLATLISLFALLCPSMVQATDPYDNEYFKIEFYNDGQLIKDGEKQFANSKAIVQLLYFGQEFKIQMNPYFCKGSYNIYAKVVLKDSIQHFRLNDEAVRNQTFNINFSNLTQGTFYHTIDYKGKKVATINQRCYPFTQIKPTGVSISYKGQALQFITANPSPRCTLYVVNGMFDERWLNSTITVTETDLFHTSESLSMFHRLSYYPSSLKQSYETGDIVRCFVSDLHGSEECPMWPVTYEIYLVNDVTTGIENQNQHSNTITINDHPVSFNYEGELQEVQLISSNGQSEKHHTNDIHTLQQGISIVRAVTHKGVYLSKVILK